MYIFDEMISAIKYRNSKVILDLRVSGLRSNLEWWPLCTFFRSPREKTGCHKSSQNSYWQNDSKARASVALYQKLKIQFESSKIVWFDTFREFKQFESFFRFFWLMFCFDTITNLGSRSWNEAHPVLKTSSTFFIST